MRRAIAQTVWSSSSSSFSLRSGRSPEQGGKLRADNYGELRIRLQLGHEVAPRNLCLLAGPAAARGPEDRLAAGIRRHGAHAGHDLWPIGLEVGGEERLRGGVERNPKA